MLDGKRNVGRQQELRNRELVAQSDLDAAQVQHDSALAQYDANVAQENAQAAAVTSAEAQLKVAMAMLESAKAQVAQSEANLRQAEINLEHTVIIAPVDGVVVSRTVDVGQTVAASLQAPTLFTIAQDLTKMQVDTNVDEADIGRVALDQEATFTVDSHPGQTFRGRVVQIRQAPQVVQNVVTYDTVVAVGNPELKLMPGMTANVKILVARREGTLLVPNAAFRVRVDGVTPAAAAGSPGQGGAQQRMAVGRPGAPPGTGSGRGPEPSARGAADGGKQRIWVLQDGKPVEKMVRTGLSDGQKTEILEGLREGDAVVVGLGTQPRGGSGAPGGPGSGSPGSPRLRL